MNLPFLNTHLNLTDIPWFPNLIPRHFSNVPGTWTFISRCRRLNFMRQALQCMEAKQNGQVPIEWWPRNVSRHSTTILREEKQRKFLKLKDAVKLISGKCTYLENEEIMLMNVEETASNCTWDVLGRCRWKKILSWKTTECVIDAAPASEQWLKNFCCQRKTLALQKLLNALELQFHPGTWQKSSRHLVFEIVRKSQCLGSTEHVAGFGNLM